MWFFSSMECAGLRSTKAKVGRRLERSTPLHSTPLTLLVIPSEAMKVLFAACSGLVMRVQDPVRKGHWQAEDRQEGLRLRLTYAAAMHCVLSARKLLPFGCNRHVRCCRCVPQLLAFSLVPLFSPTLREISNLEAS